MSLNALHELKYALRWVGLYSEAVHEIRCEKPTSWFCGQIGNQCFWVRTKQRLIICRLLLYSYERLFCSFEPINLCLNLCVTQYKQSILLLLLLFCSPAPPQLFSPITDTMSPQLEMSSVSSAFDYFEWKNSMFVEDNDTFTGFNNITLRVTSADVSVIFLYLLICIFHY